MKKQDMINTIKEREKEAWEKLRWYENNCGFNDINTNIKRIEWSTLYTLLKDLGIEEER